MSDGSNIVKFPKDYVRKIDILPTLMEDGDIPLETFVEGIKERKPVWIATVEVDENGQVAVVSSSDNIFEAVYYLAWAHNFLLTAEGDDNSDEDQD